MRSITITHGDIVCKELCSFSTALWQYSCGHFYWDEDDFPGTMAISEDTHNHYYGRIHNTTEHEVARMLEVFGIAKLV